MSERKRNVIDLHFGACGSSVGSIVIESVIKERSRWLAGILCNCGVRKIVLLGNIRNGTTKSCGNPKCSPWRKHGYFTKDKKNKVSPPPEYIAWSAMKQRAKGNAKKNPRYKLLFSITQGVSDEWLKYENFLRDMGPKPFPDYTLERINNNLGYCRENCVWASRTDQAKNTSRNVWLEYKGKQYIKSEILALLKINKNYLNKYLRLGYCVEEIEKIHNKLEKKQRKK